MAIINGFCPKCGTKIVQGSQINICDDFSLKCWYCKKIVEVRDINYKRDDAPIKIKATE